MVESQQFFSFCFVSFTRSTNFDRKSSHHQKQKIKKKKKIIFKILFKKKGEKKIYEIEKKGRRARLRIQKAKLAPDLNRLLIKRRMRKKGTSASQSSISSYGTSLSRGVQQLLSSFFFSLSWELLLLLLNEDGPSFPPQPPERKEKRPSRIFA